MSKALRLFLIKRAQQEDQEQAPVQDVEGQDTPEGVMKGDYELVGYIDGRGVTPKEKDPNFPIKGTDHHWAYDPDEGPTCRQCHMYYLDEGGVGRCTNVAGEIHPMGSCDIYTAGPDAEPEMDNPYKLPKMNVTYVINGTEGFTCKRCTAFVPDKPNKPEGPGRCKVLEPPVEGNGCCFAWNNPDATYVVEAGTKIEEEEPEGEEGAEGGEQPAEESGPEGESPEHYQVMKDELADLTKNGLPPKGGQNGQLPKAV